MLKSWGFFLFLIFTVPQYVYNTCMHCCCYGTLNIYQLLSATNVTFSFYISAYRECIV